MALSHSRLPQERIGLHGCTAAEPLRFWLSTTLGEIFVPSNEERADLPLALSIGPEKNGGYPKRDWTVPFPNGIRLSPALMKRPQRKLKAVSLSKLVLQQGRVRDSIEQFMLGWVEPHISVDVYHFPEGYMGGRERRWRIDVKFCGDPIAQWNGSHEIVDNWKLFTNFSHPLI